MYIYFDFQKCHSHPDRRTDMNTKSSVIIFCLLISVFYLSKYILFWSLISFWGPLYIWKFFYIYFFFKLHKIKIIIHHESLRNQSPRTKIITCLITSLTLHHNFRFWGSDTSSLNISTVVDFSFPISRISNFQFRGFRISRNFFKLS